jgi:RHS repeat-associated protein
VSHGSGLISSFLHFFVAEDGSPLTNSFGLGNWTGLAALVIVAGLLVTSTDAALRKLKFRPWKWLQRTTHTTNYSYDGEGRRVMKSTDSGPKTVYVYDAMGKLVAEYSEQAPDPQCTTCYLTADHLGSTRVITDPAGNCVSRYDYLPFGEEITTANRTSTSCYTTGNLTLKFTGKERDVETGLDYFGARYFSGAQGRFTSPDEPLFDQDPVNPQSWNLYSYVRNNPLRFIDSTGRKCVTLDNGGVGDDGLGDACTDTSLQTTHGVIVGGTTGDVTAAVFGDAVLMGDIDPTGRRDQIRNVDEQLLVAGVAARQAARLGIGLLSRLAPAAPIAFQAGQTIDRIVNTSKGPVRFVAEVEVKGSQLVLKDILVYPTETGGRLQVGVRELLEAGKGLLDEARQAGFETVRFIGDRSAAAGSANPGRAVDFTKTLK